MKTDIEIRQDIFGFIVASDIKTAIAGKVSYTNDHEAGEDCMISVPDNENGQIQEVFVYVRVYVPNINSNGKSVENVARTGQLAKLCSQVLESGFGQSFRFSLDKQITKPVNGKNEHCISNRLRYKQFNG